MSPETPTQVPASSARALKCHNVESKVIVVNIWGPLSFWVIIRYSDSEVPGF